MKSYNRINTDTTRFLLPLTGLTREIVETEYFINAYSYLDIPNILDPYSIALVYTKENKLLDNLANGRYNINDYFIYTYTVPKNAYIKIMNGKYSKVPHKNKLQILNYWNLGDNSKLFYILFPKAHMVENFNVNSGLLYRDFEIWPTMDTIKETFIPRTNETTSDNGIQSTS